MGRFFLSFFLFLLSVQLVFAATEHLSVTATVLPSSEWILLVQNNSLAQRISLPFLSFDLIRIDLSDGSRLMPNPLVEIVASSSGTEFRQTIPADKINSSWFTWPKKYPDNSQVTFVYQILNQEIPIP